MDTKAAYSKVLNMQQSLSQLRGLPTKAHLYQRPHAAATAASTRHRPLLAAAISSDVAQQTQNDIVPVPQRRPRGRPRKVTPADAAESVAVAAADRRSVSSPQLPAAADAAIHSAEPVSGVVNQPYTPQPATGARKPFRRSSSSSKSSSGSDSKDGKGQGEVQGAQGDTQGPVESLPADVTTAEAEAVQKACTVSITKWLNVGCAGRSKYVVCMLMKLGVSALP